MQVKACGLTKRSLLPSDRRTLMRNFAYYQNPAPGYTVEWWGWSDDFHPAYGIDQILAASFGQLLVCNAPDLA